MVWEGTSGPTKVSITAAGCDGATAEREASDAATTVDIVFAPTTGVKGPVVTTGTTEPLGVVDDVAVVLIASEGALTVTVTGVGDNFCAASVAASWATFCAAVASACCFATMVSGVTPVGNKKGALPGSIAFRGMSPDSDVTPGRNWDATAGTRVVFAAVKAEAGGFDPSLPGVIVQLHETIGFAMSNPKSAKLLFTAADSSCCTLSIVLDYDIYISIFFCIRSGAY